MVARVWFSRSILTPSLASTAWCRPSLQRRPGIRAAGELVHDDDLAVFHHVLAIIEVEHVRAQALLHVVIDFDHGRVVEVLDIEQLFDLGHALLGERHAAVLFIDGVVAGGPLFAGLLAFVDFAFFQLGNDAVDLVILVGGFLAGAGDDERGARFVDQDGIDFVDDGVVVPALHAILDAELHVVAQIIEAELVVGAVGDVARVGDFALHVVEVVHDYADGQSEELVDAAHPLGIALGEVVVDGDYVDALAFERVQINGAAWRPASCLRRFSFRRSCLDAEPCRRSTAHRSGAS